MSDKDVKNFKRKTHKDIINLGDIELQRRTSQLAKEINKDLDKNIKLTEKKVAMIYMYAAAEHELFKRGII